MDYAAGYLIACLEEGEAVFLLGVRDVVEVQGEIRVLASKASLNRENFYDMFSQKGNPRLSSLTLVLDELGLGVKFCPKLGRRKAV